MWETNSDESEAVHERILQGPPRVE